MITISPTIARRMAIVRQRLAGPRPAADVAGMLELVRDLRCLQLDPISTVARSHLLVLWSRLGNYDPAALDTLLWDERRLFEYWAHCASMVLVEDYPLYQPMMREHGQGTSAWAQRLRTFVETNHALRDHLLDEMRIHGPLPSRHFEAEAVADWHSTGWTSGRNVSRMLDYLWIAGTIMVAGRAGGQKLWDLAERCLPAWTPRDDLPPEELVYRAAQHSLRALGVARSTHIQNHFIRGRYPSLPNILKRLEADGRVARVQIEETCRTWTGPWYVHCDDLPLLEQLQAGVWEPRTTLLSPFDNLICDRARTEVLWDFRFRIEIYVPKAKREFGYYVLPILYGDRLIGRIDPLMDRARQRLVINALYAEPDAPMAPEVGLAIGGAIRDLASFLGATDVEFAGTAPDSWKHAVG